MEGLSLEDNLEVNLSKPIKEYSEVLSLETNIETMEGISDSVF